MKSDWMIWPGQPGMSILIWGLLAITLMYLARVPAHRAIRAASRVMAQAMRLAARSVVIAQERLEKRNRAVLLSAGQAQAETQIKQEFQRVHTAVARDLGAYPALHRKLIDQIERMDQDYRDASENPPALPSWLSAMKVVEGVTKKGHDPLLAKALEGMSQGLVAGHKEALAEYRVQTAKRHDLLNGMMPYWRNLSDTLKGVEKTVAGLDDRSRHIDDQMGRYEQMVGQTNRAQRMLSSSSMTQFFVAGLVLMIAMLGGFINFQLIALPMSEMVGASSHLGWLKTSDVAALVIIMVEVAMGLFLMESLRITHLFPVIGSLDDRMRKRMAWVTFAILLILACVESSLAYMRDLLAADREALTQALSGVQAAQPEFRWIPALGQMIMGFILPFALTFVAIPLESFIHASRTVIGTVLAAALRVLAFTARLVGRLSHHLGSILITVYDLIIFVPLRMESAFQGKPVSPKSTNAPAAPVDRPKTGLIGK